MTQNPSMLVDAKKLLHSSIRQYKEMADLLTPFKEGINSAPRSLVDVFNNSFQILQSNIKDTDATILAVLNDTRIQEEFSALINERTILQRSVLQCVQNTIQHAKAVKSLLANEILTLKQGRASLKGYAGNLSDTNRFIINNKS